MSRKYSVLMSMGLSVALLAIGIWFLSDYHAMFGYGGRGWHMPRHGMMGFGGMGLVMIFFWAAVIGAVALVISALLTGRGDSDPSMRTPQDAVEILKQRYARGEIDKAQLDEMRRDIGQGW